MAARYRASMGEVYEAAMNEPGCGSRLLCFPSDLQYVSILIVSSKITIAYPRLTPSTWRSIHQIPGTPSMHHNAAFLPNDPIGSQLKHKKYASIKPASRGTRHANRNR